MERNITANAFTLMVSRAFSVYRRNFLTCLALVFAVMGSIVAPLACAAILVVPHLQGLPQEQSAFVFLLVVAGIVFWAATLYYFAVTVAAGLFAPLVADRAMEDPLRVADVFRAVRPRLRPLLMGAALAALLVGLGSVLLGLPGVIIGFVLSLTGPAIVTEQLSAVQGIRRSRAVLQEALGPLLMLSAVTGVVLLIISKTAAIVPVVLSLVVLPQPPEWLSTVLFWLGALLFAPIPLLLLPLLFFDTVQGPSAPAEPGKAASPGVPIEFLDPILWPAHKVPLGRDEHLYPWLSLHGREEFGYLAEKETRDGKQLELSCAYQKRSVPGVFFLAHGALMTLLFRNALPADSKREVTCLSAEIVKLALLRMPQESDPAPEPARDEPCALPDEQTAFLLVVQHSSEQKHAHLFRLPPADGFENQKEWNDARGRLWNALSSATPPDRLLDSRPRAKAAVQHAGFWAAK